MTEQRNGVGWVALAWAAAGGAWAVWLVWVSGLIWGAK